MDKVLAQSLAATVAASPGVSGALAVDENGLLLASHGLAPATCAPAVTAIANRAAALHGLEEDASATTSGAAPAAAAAVVRIEADNAEVVLKQVDGVTTALFLEHK